MFTLLLSRPACLKPVPKNLHDPVHAIWGMEGFSVEGRIEEKDGVVLHHTDDTSFLDQSQGSCQFVAVCAAERNSTSAYTGNVRNRQSDRPQIFEPAKTLGISIPSRGKVHACGGR